MKNERNAEKNSEKSEKREPSRQICVYKTQTSLLEFNSLLQPSSAEFPWHLHAEGKADGSWPSLIRAVMVDYRDKGHSVSVYANLSPELVKYFYAQVSHNVQGFKFSQQKIFQESKESGQGRVTVFMIQRKTENEKGEILNNPWSVHIQNGTGTVAHNANGGQYCRRGSYKKEAQVTVQMRDEDLFALLSRTVAVINAFEYDAISRRRNAGNFQTLYRKVERLFTFGRETGKAA